ncbi:uncharacterized protein CMU_009440 [Cryptosporidium muris RN66]|uniref:Uncharacterized protein n=1 Tax=Cryptosporidium muris (strain RN66) TaxID=441375 RepID=B6AE11_CRYMR|nr:uncharacterized protein CMU_009440 [Cryptosporidium muris RN66]EEA06452.1 hypothetical protein, conserved [Cryptosporidium muris RN66]|eukprot:XP_002140801.1 hypothetical protein [Cryptosporidium muris RN66]
MSLLSPWGNNYLNMCLSIQCHRVRKHTKWYRFWDLRPNFVYNSINGNERLVQCADCTGFLKKGTLFGGLSICTPEQYGGEFVTPKGWVTLASASVPLNRVIKKKSSIELIPSDWKFYDDKATTTLNLGLCSAFDNKRTLIELSIVVVLANIGSITKETPRHRKWFGLVDDSINVRITTINTEHSKYEELGENEYDKHNKYHKYKIPDKSLGAEKLPRTWQLSKGHASMYSSSDVIQLGYSGKIHPNQIIQVILTCNNDIMNCNIKDFISCFSVMCRPITTDELILEAAEKSAQNYISKSIATGNVIFQGNLIQNTPPKPQMRFFNQNNMHQATIGNNSLIVASSTINAGPKQSQQLSKIGVESSKGVKIQPFTYKVGGFLDKQQIGARNYNQIVQQPKLTLKQELVTQNNPNIIKNLSVVADKHVLIGNPYVTQNKQSITVDKKPNNIQAVTKKQRIIQKQPIATNKTALTKKLVLLQSLPIIVEKKPAIVVDKKQPIVIEKKPSILEKQEKPITENKSVILQKHPIMVQNLVVERKQPLIFEKKTLIKRPNIIKTPVVAELLEKENTPKVFLKPSISIAPVESRNSSPKRISIIKGSEFQPEIVKLENQSFLEKLAEAKADSTSLIAKPVYLIPLKSSKKEVVQMLKDEIEYSGNSEADEGYIIKLKDKSSKLDIEEILDPNTLQQSDSSETESYSKYLELEYPTTKEDQNINESKKFKLLDRDKYIANYESKVSGNKDNNFIWDPEVISYDCDTNQMSEVLSNEIPSSDFISNEESQLNKLSDCDSSSLSSEVKESKMQIPIKGHIETHPTAKVIFGYLLLGGVILCIVLASYSIYIC